MGNRIIAACVAIVAAGSLLVSSAFASPAELLHNDIAAPAPITVQSAALPADDDDDDLSPDEERRGRRGLRATLRGWLLRLPFAARAALLLPLYLLGTLLSALLSAAYALAEPALGFLLGALLKTALLAAVFALLFHAVFPLRKLREFFTRKNLLALAAGGLLLQLADKLLPRLLPEYALLRAGVSALLELAVLLALWFITFGYRSMKGYPVRRIFRRRGWLTLLLALAGCSLLRFGLTLLTWDGFWRFLPETLPFFALLFLFALLVWRRSRPKRPHLSPQLA